MAKTTPVPALAEALARARTLAAEMNAATDDLNDSLTEVEKALADLKLGVTAEVVMESDDEGPWCSLLAFGKDQQAWRLLYKSGNFMDEGDYSVSPLVNSSRATRLMAVEFLAPLVDGLVKTADEEVEKVRASVKAVRDLAKQIKKNHEVPF